MKPIIKIKSTHLPEEKRVRNAVHPLSEEEKSKILELSKTLSQGEGARRLNRSTCVVSTLLKKEREKIDDGFYNPNQFCF
jgi:IS30 family transposase